MTPRRLPVPVAPEPKPPESTLKRLLRQRFILVALVIIAFFAMLFVWDTWQKIHTPELTPPPKAKALEAKKPPEAHKEAALPQEPAPAKETPSPAPLPAAPAVKAPPPPPPRQPVKGEVFTRALIKIMDDQVNKTWFGWRPNTILFGKMGLTDNVNHVQMGVLEVARRTIIVLNEHLTRFAITEAYNPNINEAMNFFMVSADKYWFPSASGKYREAIRDLESYVEALSRGRSRFYSRVDNLMVLMSNYKDLLGSSFHNLTKDKEADGSAISWFVVDDYFYFSQGIALGMAQMLQAVEVDFHAEIQKKNLHKLLEDAIHALREASHLRPWVVTNGSKDGILANHRANMSTYVGEAEHVISTLQMALGTN
ncbi:MAG: DUF2333 family protein [Deltaproteobacteria bacterium]|nr:DUF2333 family protein [Deltaproteobacteria bacterium]